MQIPGIFTSKDAERFFPEDSWELSALQSIRRIMTNRGFPCHFARIAEATGCAYFAFATSPHDETQLQHIVTCLSEFTNMTKASRKRRRHTLLVTFKPETNPQDNEYYAKAFWGLLNYLHQHDQEAWPTQIATTPDDPNFEFCFNGVPMFTFANTPAYSKRRSRNLGDSFVVVFNPYSSFSGVQLLTPGGKGARTQIRKRLESYDRVACYGEFGQIDGDIPLAWKSYFIPDDNVPMSTPCPFHYRGKPDQE
ncbi:MAG TPA: YqcI/YcgG family protein [Ktedonobacteraceae bacterium]|nr:YqcI/YcgG family protein [Ktedonobacteraceae bacterium]